MTGLDKVFRALLATIEEYGWAVRHAGAGDGHAAFSYTIGLTAMGHPEIGTTGLPFDVAQVFLNLIGAEVRGGATFTAGQVTAELTSPDAPVVFIAVEEVDELAAVSQVYGSVTALQMVWPDSAGHLPWQAGYRNGPDTQPLLGPRPKP